MENEDILKIVEKELLKRESKNLDSLLKYFDDVKQETKNIHDRYFKMLQLSIYFVGILMATLGLHAVYDIFWGTPNRVHKEVSNLLVENETFEDLKRRVKEINIDTVCKSHYVNMLLAKNKLIDNILNEELTGIRYFTSYKIDSVSIVSSLTSDDEDIRQCAYDFIKLLEFRNVHNYVTQDWEGILNGLRDWYITKQTYDQADVEMISYIDNFKSMEILEYLFFEMNLPPLKKRALLMPIARLAGNRLIKPSRRLLTGINNLKNEYEILRGEETEQEIKNELLSARYTAEAVLYLLNEKDYIGKVQGYIEQEDIEELLPYFYGIIHVFKPGHNDEKNFTVNMDVVATVFKNIQRLALDGSGNSIFFLNACQENIGPYNLFAQWYHIICLDDHSTDKVWREIFAKLQKYPRDSKSDLSKILETIYNELQENGQWNIKVI